MKKLLFLFVLLPFLNLNAQNLSNVSFVQDGGEIIAKYDLTGKADALYKVKVFYSENQIKWFELETLYGECGDSIKAGNGKEIAFWADHLEEVKGTEVFLKLMVIHDALDKQPKGKLNDSKGNSYDWVRVENTRWMVQNLHTNISGAVTQDAASGALYNVTLAKDVCPDQWNLASDENWQELEIAVGMDASQAGEFGLRQELDLNKINQLGLETPKINYNIKGYGKPDISAFWTATRNKLHYQGSDKYFARIFRYDVNKISRELRVKTENLSVKCTQPATFVDTFENTIKHSLEQKVLKGKARGLTDGIKFEWQQFGDRVWMKKDFRGTHIHPGLNDECPEGWRLPFKDEWLALFNSFEADLNIEDQSVIVSERMMSEGLWGFFLQETDYWTNNDYYIYQTFWINRNDKEDSKKTIEYPSNKEGKIEWIQKQTNERGKIRCILDSKEYIELSKSIDHKTLVDSRDKTEYQTVVINGSEWMSENLNYILEGGTHCRNETPAECKRFGYMYNIKVTNEACPEGWKVPSSDDWEKLFTDVKDNHKLRALRPFGPSGFNLLLGGDYDKEIKPVDRLYNTKFWYIDGETSGYYYFNIKGEYGKEEIKPKKKDYFYIRCIKK